jgi:hypothetical protein
MRVQNQPRIKLDKKLNQHNIQNGQAKVGVGITAGNDVLAETKDGDKVLGGKFAVLWYERRYNKSQNKMAKYLKRKTIRLVGNRDMQEQIISGISRFAGHLLT